MIVNTYYTDCPKHNKSNELDLLHLWRGSWSARDVETRVITEQDAAAHPYFTEYREAVSKLPSVNTPEYELACWLRWLALAHVGGGFMSDYDVFANGDRFHQSDIEEAAASSDNLHAFHTINPCPSFVYASAKSAERICREFASGKLGKRDMGGRTHYSDMLALEDLVIRKTEWITTYDMVRDYEGTPEWRRAQLVHFCNATTTPRGYQPRHKHIPTLLAKIA